MELKNRETYEIEIGDAAFTGAPLRASEIRAISARHTKIKRGVEVTDSHAAARETFCRMVTGWDGVTLDGKPTSCTEETKRFLFEEHNDLAGEIMEKLAAERAARREGLEKNSESTPSAA